MRRYWSRRLDGGYEQINIFISESPNSPGLDIESTDDWNLKLLFGYTDDSLEPVDVWDSDDMSLDILFGNTDDSIEPVDVWDSDDMSLDLLFGDPDST